MELNISTGQLHSIERMAGSVNAKTVAANAEEQLVEGHEIDVVHFARAYYPMSFVTGKAVSFAVLEWLFPSPSAAVVSPLGELTQRFLLTHGLFNHMSVVGFHEGLEFFLNSGWFSGIDGVGLADDQCQQILNAALRCAQDAGMITVLLAHGADPQAKTLGLLTSPWASADKPSFVAPVVENGVFTVGDTAMLADHIGRSNPVDTLVDLLRAGVETTGALAKAVALIRADILKAIVENSSVDIDWSPPNRGSPVLIQAIVETSPLLATKGSIVEVLVSLGANVNTRGSNGTTALCEAVRRGSVPVVELLLQHGADANLCEANGLSPLHWACSGQPPVLCLDTLLKNRANPNKRDRRGRTSLHVAVSNDAIMAWRTGEAAKMLITHGADIYLRDPDTNESALQTMVRRSRMA